MLLRIALPFPGLREDGRGAAGTTHNLPTPGDAIKNPSAAYRETKMLVTLREDPVPFLEVLLQSHLASRACACACEWLRLSCSLPGFHCVLVKDTSDQTRLLRYRRSSGL